LRLKANITQEAVESLRFHKSIQDEMQWVYGRFGDKVYDGLKTFKQEIEKWLEKNEIKITAANKKKLFDRKFWKTQRKLMETAQRLFEHMGSREYNDFNLFQRDVDNTLKSPEIKSTIRLSASEKKTILNAVSFKDEQAEPVIKKIEKDGSIIYEPDSDLRDSENVPLNEDIETYFEREVLQYVPDAWIDHSKTVKGYEISFTRYFYNYEPPRSLEDIAADIEKLQSETEGLLEEFIDV
jgi:type I restriction enzyme M protein